MSVPWLDQPVMLHSDRDPGTCDMTPEQCAFKKGYWVFWYEADHRYALPTVAFILACIVVFSLGHAVSVLSPESWTRSRSWTRVVSVVRLASYKSWRLGRWNSQSLGTYLLGAVGFVFFTTMTLAPKPYYWPDSSYGHSPPIATRAGWMALGCMPFIILLATKANPIATVLGTSHEKLVVWHNWLAWAMFVLALVHTFPFIVDGIDEGTIVASWNDGGVWVTGVIALLAQAFLTFFSIRWLRERFYEFFKATHFFAAIVFVIFFFLHCDFRMTSWDYFIVAGVLYSLSWAYSQLRVYLQYGVGMRARLVLETDRMMRISVTAPPSAATDWSPGQHMLLRFPGFAGPLHSLTSHPFTICSLPPADDRSAGSTMVFYVRPRGGMTARLARLARLAAGKPGGAVVPVLLDGPYGGLKGRWFDGFDHTVVVGGGAGVGFTLALARDFLAARRRCRRRGADGGGGIVASAEPRMTLVVSARDPDLSRWYTDALSDMFGEEKDPRNLAGLSIRIHHTDAQVSPPDPGPATTSAASADGSEPDPDPDPEMGSKSAALSRIGDFHARLQSSVDTSVFHGRADLTALGREILSSARGQTVGIVVCGPASMVHDVGAVAASAQVACMKGQTDGPSEVWFHKETFS
ncbi:reductase [Geosmithia morbida]|uniref:ferric-chelate reductase (NADPH) n=1 Tax=Geosmithia morbida TaxID=1094350 RepID=A0A9P5D790_9HYPO|nr:reductase [Geosmithia morbida]KAF4125555.1 reductase [Geosmithia morbida]